MAVILQVLDSVLFTFLVIALSVAYWYGKRAPAAPAAPAAPSAPAAPLPHDAPAALEVSGARAAAPAKSASSRSPPPAADAKPLKKTGVKAKAAGIEAMLGGGLDARKFAQGVSPKSANVAPTRAPTTGDLDTSPMMIGEVDTSSGRSVKDLRKDKVFIGKLKRVMLAGGPFARPQAEERVDTISVTPPSAHYMAELKNGVGTKYTLASPSSPAGNFSIMDPNWDPNPPPSGTYTMTIYLNSKPRLVLEPAGTEVVVQESKVQEPSHLKLRATSLRVVFSERDASAPANTPVTAIFNPMGGTQVALNGKTDENGSEDFPLPAGQVHNLQAKLSSGVIINRNEPIIVAPSDYDRDSDGKDEEMPLLFNIAQNATSCAEVIEWMSAAKTRAVILGDISGSMGDYNSTQMHALRKSFREQAEAVEKKGGKFALVAWCSWLLWCPSEAWNEAQGAVWHSKLDAPTISWINNLRAGGGNNMRFAIEQAMRTYPDATDVWVMCDGDISPFTIDSGLTNCREDVPRPKSKSEESRGTSYNQTNWKAFCSRWPLVRFHFIAFHHSADRTGMPLMAQEGCGSFSQYTFSGGK